MVALAIYTNGNILTHYHQLKKKSYGERELASSLKESYKI